MEIKDYTMNRVSLIEGDNENRPTNKLISRASSVGLSSRIYYRNSEGSVPFKWERQPGKAKNPPRKEVIPPPSPPPAAQSRWLARHTRVYNPDYYQKDSSSIFKLRFWKKRSKKNMHVQHLNEKQEVAAGVHKYETVEFGDSDGELTGSTNDARSSPSTSSSSSNGRSSLQQSRLNPWNYILQIEEDPRAYDEQEERTACANESDGALFKTNLSRNSKVNHSSRLYYQNPGRVPFDWEKLPGTSKNPAKSETIPPPSPPPAVQGLGLSTPRAEFQSDQNATTNSLRLFFKKCKINLETKKTFNELSLHHKSGRMNVGDMSLASASSRNLSTTMWKVVAKSSCYGAGKPKTIVCAPTS